MFNCRQPQSELDNMAMSGTLLPSIATFASGGDVKHKAGRGPGTGGSVSIKQVIEDPRRRTFSIPTFLLLVMSSAVYRGGAVTDLYFRNI